MAWVTPIGSNPQQIDYRLGQQHGCVGKQVNDRQFAYHTDLRERPLRWIGAGLADVEIETGTELTSDQFDKARALLLGRDPRTGEQLVTHKLAVPREAKVPLAPLVRAIEGIANEARVDVDEVLGSDRLVGMFHTAARAVERHGELALLRADHAGQLVDAARLRPAEVWDDGVYEAAVANLTKTVQVIGEDGAVYDRVVPNRIVVGNLGYDVTLTLPKSYSLLLTFADEDTAAAVEKIYTEQANTIFAWLEGHTAYGMRGHHGDGQTAQTVPGTGFLGCAMMHRAARPVDGAQVGDPHWHVHYTIANMTHGIDGRWSTVASGGRDLMRHVPAADKLLQATTRKILTERYGITWRRSERTKLWEVGAIPDDAIHAFSRRGADIEAMLLDLGFPAEDASRSLKQIVKLDTRGHKNEATAALDATLRELWQRQACDHSLNPDQLARTALANLTAPLHADPIRMPTLDELATRLQDVDDGVTAHTRRFSRLDALAAIADALPAGATPTELEHLTNEVLHRAGFVALTQGVAVQPVPGRRAQLGAAHMANADLYTTQDIADAEKIIADAVAGSADNQTAIRVDPTTAAMAASTVEAAQGFTLSGEQHRELMRITTSGRAIDALIGGPGSGKTTLMRAVRVAYESHGFVTCGAATQGVAAQTLQADTGVPSLTVAQWLWRINHGPGLAGVDVLILDEATLTNDRDRADLYRAAARSGSKLLEIGDPKQLRGVGCGSMFATVHQLVRGGQLVDNRRQVIEDERAAIKAWRDGDYSEALTSWADRDRLVTTETTAEATAAMLATWMDQRQGAPTPVVEMRGLLMVAATNEQVDRLNDAAQAVRGSAGELGPTRTYHLAAERELHLRVGDYVLIKITDRRYQLHDGPELYNGYRGLVDRIHADGSVDVRWERDTIGGRVTETATVSADYIAKGGLALGYALTIHKSQGLTIGAGGATWAGGDGEQRGGAVLFHTAGADNPGQYVAASRHLLNLWLFAARTEVEHPQDTYLHGVPASTFERTRRVITKLVERAKATETNANDTPVLADLGQLREPTPVPQPDGPGASPATAVTSQTVPRLAADGNDRRAEATALIRETWNDHPAVAAVIAGEAFDAVAYHLAVSEANGHDPKAMLRRIEPDDLIEERIISPSAFAAWQLGQLRRSIATAPDREQHKAPTPSPADAPEPVAGRDAVSPRLDLLVPHYELTLAELAQHIPDQPVSPSAMRPVAGLPPWLQPPPTHRNERPDRAVTLADVADRHAARIRQRVATLAQRALDQRPNWVTTLGPEPDTAMERLRYRAAVTAIAAYREQYRITGNNPLGAAPEHSRQRLAFNSAQARLEAARGTHRRSASPPGRDRQRLLQRATSSAEVIRRRAERIVAQQQSNIDHTDDPRRNSPQHGHGY